MDGDLTYNDGKHVWIRLDGIYYRRDIGVGFVQISESALPEGINFAPMHEKQRAVFKSQLPSR